MVTVEIITVSLVASRQYAEAPVKDVHVPICHVKTVANPQSHAVKLTCFKLTYLTVFIRCSKTCKFGSYSPQLPIILLSMSEANICVSRNRERNGRCRCGWSDKNDALSKLTIDSLDDSQDSRSCNQIKKHKSLQIYIIPRLFRNLIAPE